MFDYRLVEAPANYYSYHSRGDNMRSLHLSNPLPVYKNELLHSSKGKNTSLYEIIFPHQHGLNAHIHTSGEDCALVLSGNLTYFVGNRETIEAERGSIVFGWQNVLHGYLNQEKEPVHLLVFVTPSKIGLAYPDDDDPVVRKVPVERRKVHAEEEVNVSSEYSSFQTILVYGRFEEPEEPDTFKVFIDWKKKQLFIFDKEKVELTTDEPVHLLKYVAKS
jgi:quercetin dioxygenase-like cupin family protein